VYGAVIESWARTDAPTVPLDRTARACRAQWARGAPLLSGLPPALDRATIEGLLSRMMDLAAVVREDAAEGLARLADAWDEGRVTPEALFPVPGGVGALDPGIGLPADVVAFLAIGTLRPLLEPFLARSREHLADHDWALGSCPFCGAPPGFGDVVEDGRRRLACHLCGGSWLFARLRCPFCGTEDSKDLARLEPESTDQGYFLSTCARCHGYLKELDRRVRWNGGPALVEDWGSPHFDIAAARQGLSRPLAPLILGHRAGP
jgi:hypothetical protein